MVSLYLIVGGMPAAVNAYVQTQNMQNVHPEESERELDSGRKCTQYLKFR
ncbi:MAG: hypothetical protein ACI4TU_00475 [Candidatus Cryptobacteroides sp.]